MTPSLLTSVHPDARGLEIFFGSLETAVLEQLWAHAPCSARVIFEALRDEGRRLAYATVRTVLERLNEKRIVTRTQTCGDSHLTYAPCLDRTALLRQLVSGTIAALAENEDPAIAAAARSAMVIHMSQESNDPAATQAPAAVAGPGSCPTARAVGGDIVLR